MKNIVNGLSKTQLISILNEYKNKYGASLLGRGNIDHLVQTISTLVRNDLNANNINVIQDFEESDFTREIILCDWKYIQSSYQECIVSRNDVLSDLKDYEKAIEEWYSNLLSYASDRTEEIFTRVMWETFESSNLDLADNKSYQRFLRHFSSGVEEEVRLIRGHR